MAVLMNTRVRLTTSFLKINRSAKACGNNTFVARIFIKSDARTRREQLFYFLGTLLRRMRLP